MRVDFWISGVWKTTDYGNNLYPPVPDNNATIDTAPMIVDLNERVAEEMKKDIFVYFRHYSVKRDPSIWSELDSDSRKSEKPHWWAKIKVLYSKARRKLSTTPPSAADDHDNNNS
uniref:Uncharacterized protein n=1 Tax=Lygus hesperus TaxID=30085 RepID=A0A146M0W8_LYGHE